MKLSKILSPDLIKIGIDSVSKEDIIRELIKVLDDDGLVADADQAFGDVLDRELQQSTGLEKGIAIPHGKSNSVSQLVGMLGVCAEGIDFASLDGEPSQMFFLLIAPPDQLTQHIKALSNIAKITQNSNFKRRLLKAETSEEAFRLIKDMEESEE